MYKLKIEPYIRTAISTSSSFLSSRVIINKFLIFMLESESFRALADDVE